MDTELEGSPSLSLGVRPKRYRRRGDWCRVVRELHAKGLTDERIAAVLNGEDAAYDQLGALYPRQEMHRRTRNPPRVYEDQEPEGGWFTPYQIRRYRRSEGLKGNRPPRGQGPLALGAIRKHKLITYATSKGWFGLVEQHPWIGLREIQILELVESLGPQTKAGLRQGLQDCYGAKDQHDVLHFKGGSRLARLVKASLLQIVGHQRRDRLRLPIYGLAEGVHKHYSGMRLTSVDRLFGGL